MADKEKVRALTLDEVMNGSGTGYEEDWLPPDGDDPAIKTLKPCVYLMGDVLEFDLCYATIVGATVSPDIEKVYVDSEE